MRILAIRIKNLASLEGDTSIDFSTEPLSSAGIFAITGPTGSGKSTILDALCLALYGRTPRYRQAETGIEVKDVQGSFISQGDVRGILRDGTAAGFAEVDFVGVDQQHYRARWSVWRARNRADGNLQPQELTLRNLSTNTNIPGRRSELQSEIERLVGLNFEQFTRSVLLAQGDFTAFLKANKDEKSSLLEKLTGTQVYSEISKRIFDRHREESQQLRDLNVQREGISTLTTEDLEELGVQRAGLETSIRGLEQKISELTAEISWYEQLTVLQVNRDAAHRGQEQAIAGQQAAYPRVELLQRVDRVQTIRPAIENQHKIQLQLDEMTDLLRHYQESLERLESEQEAFALTLQEAEGNLTKKTAEQETATPGLDRAKALDVELTEKAKQIKEADGELRAVAEREEELNRTLEVRRNEAEAAAAEVARLSGWKMQNAARQSIAENESLILSKLNDAAVLLEKQRSIGIALQQIGQGRARVERERDSLAVQEEERTTELQKIREDYDRSHAALVALSLESLELDKASVDGYLVQLSEGLARWELLWAATQEQEGLKAKLAAQEQENELGQEELVKTEQEADRAGIQKEISRQALERVQLAASENVEQMRAQLTTDEPCPVCGSREHPYAAEDPQLDRVLAELKTMAAEHEQTHLRLSKAQAGLQQVIDGLTKEIVSLKKDRADREVRVQKLEETWAASPLYSEATQEPAAQRTGWLLGRRKQEEEKQGQLQEQLQAAHQLQKQVETLREDRDRREKELVGIKGRVQDSARDLELLGEKQQQQSKELQEAEEGLKGIERELTGYYTADGWFTHWKANSKEGEQVIRGLVVEWKSNLLALDKQLLDQKTLGVTINGYEGQLAGIGTDRERQEQRVGGLKTEADELGGQRAQLFAGRPAVVVERELKEAVDGARQAVDKCREERENLGKIITRTITEKEQNEKGIRQSQQELIQIDRQIREWLSAYNRDQEENLATEDLVELLEYTAEWMEAERKALRVLDDAAKQAQTVLAERELVLARHLQQRRPERTPEELQGLFVEARSKLQESTREFNEIEFRLKEDADHKQKIGDLLQEIGRKSQVVENWAKLNEVIGSADGKKFRQVAQEYTLDVLLQFSNIHLQRLSSRYVLRRIPNSLGLSVVDQDMGDEVRSVYSISGGESFLVSLSLALGLASLTSSRMRVESLFIDEGFGSLDPNTLNIAMDALERLHQQGRKVGVISHVQEMTERIAVQIMVSKEQSGRSRVEISSM